MTQPHVLTPYRWEAKPYNPNNGYCYVRQKALVAITKILFSAKVSLQRGG